MEDLKWMHKEWRVGGWGRRERGGGVCTSVVRRRREKTPKRKLERTVKEKRDKWKEGAEKRGNQSERLIGRRRRWRMEEEKSEGPGAPLRVIQTNEDLDAERACSQQAAASTSF